MTFSWANRDKAVFAKVLDASRDYPPHAYIVEDDEELKPLTKLFKAGFVQHKYDGYMTTQEGVEAFEALPAADGDTAPTA